MSDIKERKSKGRNNLKTSSNNKMGRINKRDDSADFELKDTSDTGCDRLEGRNPILEALRAGRTFNKILVAKGEREGSIKQIMAIAREKGIVVQEADRRNLDSISITKAHQGIIAYVSIKEYVELDDILKVAEAKGEPPFIVILDEIADANNFGSILRTADAVGVHGVVIPKRRAVGLTSTVAKASAGAVEYVPVARVANLAQTIEYLKKQNVWVVGTDQTGEKEFYNSDLKGPIALVIGSEGQGMGRLIRKNVILL
jgi:23S rRNA (guanosine2251-2'-O)-methyltransferase